MGCQTMSGRDVAPAEARNSLEPGGISCDGQGDAPALDGLFQTAGRKSERGEPRPGFQDHHAQGDDDVPPSAMPQVCLL